jgi:hypothetical protein
MQAFDQSMRTRSSIEKAKGNVMADEYTPIDINARRFDDPPIFGLAGRVFNVAGEQIATLMDLARKSTPMLTSAEVVQRVASYNSDCFWAIARRDRFNVNAPVGKRYVSFLPLTRQGLTQLLDGALDRRNPPLSVISAQHEKPARIYCKPMPRASAALKSPPLGYAESSDRPCLRAVARTVPRSHGPRPKVQAIALQVGHSITCQIPFRTGAPSNATRAPAAPA